MPIYEYQCQECGKRTEELQRVDDPPLEECRECGGPMRKLVSAPAFQFKGSGWYVTDYAGKGGGGGEAESKGSGSGGSDSKGADAKSDASAAGGSKTAAGSSSGGAKKAAAD